MKLVSIIIPVHNSEKYLQRCLDSVLQQTYKNIEIIAVENGSTDRSIDILEMYKDKIKVVVIQKASIGLARNTGLAMAKGEYISFIDSDDTMERTMIEELVTNLESEKSDLSICDLTEIYPNKKVVKHWYPNTLITSKDIMNNLIEFNYGVCNKLYKRKIVVDNDIEFPEDLKYEDVPFSIFYLSRCSVVSKVNRSLYNYLIHSKSEQTTVDKSVYDIFKILEKCSKIVKKELLEDLYVRELSTYALKMKYEKDKRFRKTFIDDVYEELNKTYPHWRKCSYIKNLKFAKALIIKNKTLLKIYTNAFNML